MEPLVTPVSADSVLGGALLTCSFATEGTNKNTGKGRLQNAKHTFPELKWGHLGWSSPPHLLPDQGQPLVSGFTGGRDGSDTVLEEV